MVQIDQVIARFLAVPLLRKWSFLKCSDLIVLNVIFFGCLWKEILSQQRIKHFKILQSIYFAYDVLEINRQINDLTLVVQTEPIALFLGNKIKFSTAVLIFGSRSMVALGI